MKRWQWWLIGTGVVLLTLLLLVAFGPLAGVGGAIAGCLVWLAGRRGGDDPLKQDLRDELDQLADDHVSTVEAQGQAEIAAAEHAARDHIAAADAALEEYANAPVTDDPADWCRPGRRDDGD